MADLEEAGLRLVAEGGDEFDSTLGSANDAFESFGNVATEVGGGIDAVSEIMTGALRAIGEMAVSALASGGAALLSFFGDSFAGALDAEQTMARLTAQIEAQGPAAAVTADQAMALADEYKHLAGGSDDAVIAAEAVLLKFNAIGSEAFPQAIEQSANLAALMGTDLASASQLLGLALDDPTSSLTRLDKATGAFTEEEKLQIAAMAEAGDVAGAQALILSNLEEAIGGTAETLALTTAGQWTIFQETIADAGESIVSALLPALNSLMADVLTPLLPIIEEVATAFGLFFEILMSGDVETAVGALGEFDTLRAVFQGLGIDVYALGEFFQGMYDFVVANIPLMQETFATVFAAIQGVFQVLSDFVNVTLMPAIASIWEQSGAQLPTAQATFESVMAGIVVATQMVSDFITNVLVPTFTYVVEWTVANWPTIQATIEAVMNAVNAIISTVITYIAAFWEVNGEAMVTNTVTSWSTIQTTITTIITAVQATITTILTAIQAFWTAHGEAIMAIVIFMMATVQTNISNGIAFVQAVITTTLTIIQAFWDTWGVTIMAITANMVETIGAVIDAFAALLQGDWETLGTSLQTIWDNTWENMGMVMETAAAALGTIISNMATAIGVVMVGFAGDLVDTFVGLGASLISGWTDAWAAIGYIVNTGVQSIMSIDWAYVGTNIISSISAGISNAAAGLAQAAADAAYAAYLAMLEALGMGSPSTLFIAAGENTQMSMATGIERAQSIPEQSMSEAMQALTIPVLSPQLSSPLSGAGMASPPLAPAFSPSASPSAGGGSGSITINLDARGASPSEVQRAVTNAIRTAAQYSDVRLRLRGAM